MDREKKKANPQLAVTIINGLPLTVHTALDSALTSSYLALSGPGQAREP